MVKIRMKIYSWLFYAVHKISKRLANKMVSLTKKENKDFYDLYYKDKVNSKK